MNNLFSFRSFLLKPRIIDNPNIRRISHLETQKKQLLTELQNRSSNKQSQRLLRHDIQSINQELKIRRLLP